MDDELVTGVTQELLAPGRAARQNELPGWKDSDHHEKARSAHRRARFEPDHQITDSRRAMSTRRDFKLNMNRIRQQPHHHAMRQRFKVAVNECDGLSFTELRRIDITHGGEPLVNAKNSPNGCVAI